MKQPNLGYADVKLNFACMHPAGCASRVSLCDYYDLCGCGACSPWFNACDDQIFFLGSKAIASFFMSACHSKIVQRQPTRKKEQSS